eukprot:jgi/Ulvmu1/6330/UM029_0038.1
MFVTVLCGLLALSGAEAAKGSSKSRNSSSKASCKLSAFSSSKSESAIVAADAAASASAHICGDDLQDDHAHAVAAATAVAEATTRAAATAVANVAADCYASGQASFKINGRSAANAEAYAFAEAYAVAIADASVCGKCSAAADFVAESWEEIFLRAVAEAEVDLEESANGGTVTARKHDFVTHVADVTITAYAAVLVSAQASVAEGCDVGILADVATGDVDDPNVVSCEINASGVDDNIEQDAIAHAVGEAAAYACDGLAVSHTHVAAKAIATAVAKAIATAGISCYVEGKGIACAYAEADIETVAAAHASAFATGYAEAINECGKCSSSVELMTDAFSDVVVNAATSAYNNVCLDKDYFHDIKVNTDVEAAHIVAIADAIASAVVDDDECNIEVGGGGASATVCEGTCAAKRRQCGGRGMAHTVGCCDVGWSCYQRSQYSDYYSCQRDDHRFVQLGFWTLHECD